MQKVDPRLAIENRNFRLIHFRSPRKLYKHVVDRFNQRTSRSIIIHKRHRHTSIILPSSKLVAVSGAGKHEQHSIEGKLSPNLQQAIRTAP